MIKDDTKEKELFNNVSKKFMGHPDYEDINLIANAKVPIIKLVEKTTKFK